MRRTVDPDEIVFLAEENERLKALTEHPSWQDLVTELQERREKETKRLAKNMMRGYPVSPEDQLRFSGFWEGVDAVLKTPGAVETRLKHSLETSNNGAQ